jgi:amino acid transporter
MAVAAQSEPRGADLGPSADFEEADRHLKKRLGFTSLLFLSLSGIIGSGWLFAVLAAAGIAGPAAILAWVIGGIFVLFIAFSWSEISAMLPRTGGIVRYPFLTHGGFTGWLVGWSYWLSAVTVPAIEAEAVVTYVGGRFPTSGLETTASGVAEMQWPLGILFGIGLMLLFFCLNYFGIRLLGEVNRWITWWKIIIPTLTFIFLFFAFKGQNLTGLSFHGQSGFFPYGIAPMFEAIALSGIIFSYLGFRQALDYGGESSDPQRHIPRATIGSVLIAMVIYTLLQVAFIGGVNWVSGGAHPGDWAGLASGAWSSGPLYDALSAAGIGALGAFATVLIFDAGISPSGTGWVYLGTSTRTNYGLSVAGSLPKALQSPNRFGIPWVALCAALVVGCVFFIPTPSWYKLVGFISSCTVLTYVMGGLCQPIMRRTAAALHRPYKLRAYQFWAPVGFLASMMIVYWSGFATLSNVFAAVFLGLPIFVWFYTRNKGWVDPVAGAVLGVVFAVVWVLICHFGGWVLTASGSVAAGAWSFGLYDILFSAAVVAFCAVTWLLCNAEGRHHVLRGFWFVFMILAVYPLSFFGAFGGECPTGISPSGGSCLAAPSIGFPYDTLIAVGIGLVAYILGLLSGFETDEMKGIVAASGTSGPQPSRPAVILGTSQA